MSFKERFGCFFLAIGMVTFLLFAIPVVQAFRKNPGTVPVEWIGVALFALLIIWIGWKLYRSARASAESQKPPSLGARIASRWNPDRADRGEDQPDRRGR
jgi:membrane protein implicated in regulation of membrane protease activity